MTIVLSDKYWDCECDSNYIHDNSQDKCPICGAVREDQPQSRVNEVTAFLSSHKDTKND